MVQQKEQTSRLEIITHEHELPKEISEHYGVLAEKVAETTFFTIFALDTHEDGSEDSGYEMMGRLVEQREIVWYSWSRPLRIVGYRGTEFLQHLREIGMKEP